MTTTDQHDFETDPSFGWACVNTVQSTPGASLFDSEIRHSRYVVLRIGRARRRRELNRDWIHPTSDPDIVEVAMSMAQWGALVSSFGTSGVPVTIEKVNGQKVEQPPHAPRLAHSVAEVEGHVDRLVADIAAKADALAAAHARKAGRTETGQLLHDLECAIRNAVPNASYAARSLTEHVENVVTKARYDIEAAARAAGPAGLAEGDHVVMLTAGDGDQP